jgi:TRAP transporter TAXI family solute receptor
MITVNTPIGIRRGRSLLVIALLLAAVLYGSAAGQGLQLRWGVAPAGSVWQVLGSAMLEDIRSECGATGSIVPSTTAANVLGVHQGTFDIAFALSDATGDAQQGQGAFTDAGEIDDVRALVSLYPQATHFVVKANSGIESAEDLGGKRVSPGARGLSSDVAAQRILEFHGLGYDSVRPQFLNFTDATMSFIDGRLDALLYTIVPVPFPSVAEAATQRDIRLLPLDDEVIDHMTSSYTGYVRYVLPAGLYQGVDYEVPGIAASAQLIVHEDFPDEDAYCVTRTIGENLERYERVVAVMGLVDREDLAADSGLEFHPGALRYYREAGLAGD